MKTAHGMSDFNNIRRRWVLYVLFSKGGMDFNYDYEGFVFLLLNFIGEKFTGIR